jgi:hypothetical protein
MDVGEFIPFPKIKIPGTRTKIILGPLLLNYILQKFWEKPS